MRFPNTYTTSLKLSFYTALIAKHPVLVFAVMTSMILMQQGESFKSTALKHISTHLISTFPHAAVSTGCSITTHANTFLQSFVYLPSGTGMHYLRRTLQAHGSALTQTPLVPTSQMTPASRLVNLHRMETWVWGFTKHTHRNMTVQNWTFIQQKFQREKSVFHNNCI